MGGMANLRDSGGGEKERSSSWGSSSSWYEGLLCLATSASMAKEGSSVARDVEMVIVPLTLR